MWRFGRVIVGVLLAMCTNIAWSSDACSTRAIRAVADVGASDGTGFGIESYFQSKDAAAIRHVRDSEQTIVIEGPQAWTRVGGDTALGADFHKLFALGHQFHAFLLYFNDIVSNVQRNGEVVFEGEIHRATSGDYPYGGTVHLVQGDDESRPVVLLFEF
jgi:hypothetical protein